MMPLLENKYVRFGLFGLGALLALFVVAVVLASLNSSRSHGTSFTQKIAPGYAMNDMATEEMAMAPSMGRAMIADGDFAETSSYYPQPVPPTPVPDGYTSGLEHYETTTYRLSARTQQFDMLCDTLAGLKSDTAIHFKSLNSSLNNCNASFFVEEAQTAGVLSQFETYKDIEINRNTSSVTRHKEQIESRTSIVRTQLESVERTLAEAEVAYDDIVALARSERDAAALNEAISFKLQQVEQLTQRKINLTSQLQNYAQQAADLEERLGVIEFSVYVQRSNPIQIGKSDRMWENAWEDLSERYTNTLIGITAFFAIFLLYVVQYGLYLLILIVFARFGWKLVKKVWRL